MCACPETMWREIYFIVVILLGISDTNAIGKCRKIKLKDTQVLKVCSMANFARSICSVECKPEYEKVGGGTRKVCWCSRRFCSWQGPSPVCEARKCPQPQLSLQNIKKVNDWKTGFSFLIEIDKLKVESIHEWSLVVVFQESLNKESLLVTWDALLTQVSWDRKIYTLISTDHNKNISRLSGATNPRILFIVTGVTVDFPRVGYIGMFDRVVRNASCIDVGDYVSFEPLRSIIPTTKATTIEKSTLTTTALAITSKPHATSTPTSTSKATTIPPTTSTQQTTVDETTATITLPSTMSTTITSSTSATATNVSSDDTNAQVKLIHERFCILQNHDEPYTTEVGWEDSGSSFFSGNAYALPHVKLFDWEVLLVFDTPIESIEVWNCIITGHSDTGHMWTFGPQSWNTVLNVELFDIAFLAKISMRSSANPAALVYLCSRQFNEGDVIFTGPGDASFYKHIQSEKNTIASSNTTSHPFISLKPTESTATHYHEVEGSTTTAARPTTEPRSVVMTPRCEADKPTGVPPVKNARQIRPGIKRNKDKTKYNYNKLIHLSILFYEAQRAGHLPKKYNRIPWRADSALKDGCDIGVDLSKGWYDAGDHVKFNFPMAFSVTMLSWGGILFRDAYRDAGELLKFISSIKWPVDYLMACHISKYELVGQVGIPKVDHGYWGRPEEMTMDRPSYIINADGPGSDLAAETAAALASASIVFKRTNRKLAQQAIRHAKELYEFADKYRGRYDATITNARQYYGSVSGYEDELLWGTAWMYRATGDKVYLDKARQIYGTMRAQYFTGPVVSWDNKLAAAQALLANITGEDIFRNQVVNFIDKMMALPKRPDGLMVYDNWAPNRYAANVAFIAIVASTLEPPLPKRQEYFEFARKQMHILLGDGGRSWVVGFGKDYPKMVHHRAGSCPPYPGICTEDTAKNAATPNPYIIYGGLVGGSDLEGVYLNDRGNYQQSEVACDYNAGYQSALAGLQHFAIVRRKDKNHFTNLGKN